MPDTDPQVCMEICVAGCRHHAFAFPFMALHPSLHPDPQYPIDTFDGDGWNDWHGRPYAYDEYYHPTAWTSRQAVDYLQGYNDSRPFLVKISFHRPHSPYDPPARVLAQVADEDVAPYEEGGNWDAVYNQDLVPVKVKTR